MMLLAYASAAAEKNSKYFSQKAFTCIWTTKKKSLSLVRFAFISTIQNTIFMGVFSSPGHPYEANIAHAQP